MNGTSPRRHFQKLASFTLESNIRQTPRHQFDRLWPGLGTVCITSLVIRALSWQLTYSSRHIADIFAGFLLPVGPRFGLIVGPRRRQGLHHLAPATPYTRRKARARARAQGQLPLEASRLNLLDALFYIKSPFAEHSGALWRGEVLHSLSSTNARITAL